MEKHMVIAGVIVTSTGLNNLEVAPGYVMVEDGKITRKGNTKEFERLEGQGALRGYNVIKMHEDQFLMPGLIDCHTHAAQFPNLGLGMNLKALYWQHKHVYPLESEFYKTDYAKDVYSQVVRRLLKNGTTTACYTGTLHLDGTMELVKSVIDQKQRALIGKISGNMENKFGYYNDINTELAETKAFIKKVHALGNDLVLPVVSPRSPLSCDNDMMNKLAKLAVKYDCRMQSHISESKDDIIQVLHLNPGCMNYAEVFDKCDVLTKKCILAHGVHLTGHEIDLLKVRDVGLVHCPASNTRLRSGICPVRKLLNHGLKIALGTDVAGGDSTSMIDAIRRTIEVSTHLEFLDGQHRAINWKEAFYLGTLGGAKVLNLDDKIGSLEVGKEFDALLIDVYAPGSPIDECNRHFVGYIKDYERLVQLFISSGDNRNILKVYIKGRLIKDECALDL